MHHQSLTSIKILWTLIDQEPVAPRRYSAFPLPLIFLLPKLFPSNYHTNRQIRKWGHDKTTVPPPARLPSVFVINCCLFLVCLPSLHYWVVWLAEDMNRPTRAGWWSGGRDKLGIWKSFESIIEWRPTFRAQLEGSLGHLVNLKIM